VRYYCELVQCREVSCEVENLGSVLSPCAGLF